MNRVHAVFILLLLLIGCKSEKSTLIESNFSLAQKQYREMLNVATEPTLYPRTTAKDGSLKRTDMYDWTSGFFAGNLWYLYEYTQDEDWKQNAIRWTESLEPLKTFKDHHDLGFMMYCSYGNAYKLTKNAKYRAILIESAESLSTRFDPKTGCIKSWNYRKSWDGKREWFYPVIIDNMMNLELLFFAAKETGQTRFSHIALTHAETTLKNHFREDFSTYHVVNYDTITGAMQDRGTSQGYTDASTWARGQAWAIYGYTMVFRETQNPKFLAAAMAAADYYLENKNLPEDKIPYWDFNVKDSNFKPDWINADNRALTIRDASAAAITASALFELSDYAQNKGKYYRDAAKTMLFNLSKNYTAEIGTNNNFVIKHCVGSFPHNEEIDVPLVYADYYYLEALMRYNKSEGK